MDSWLTRTQALIGNENLEAIKSATIAVLGLGGVGSACAESICRAGIGQIILLDHDIFDITNINRQLFATTSTVGQKKSDVAFSRLKDINPNCKINSIDCFYNDQTKQELFSLNPDYVIDAIDTVTSKISLIQECKKRKIPIISCMGTGNRLDPTSFKIGDITQTSGCGCGLSRIMRRELKKLKITDVDVLYSTEQPQSSVICSSEHGRHSPASISFCPPVAGYIMAAHVIKRIISFNKDNTTL